MSITYKQGESAILYANFQTVFSEPAEITDPKIVIKHIDALGAEIVDVPSSDMVVISGSEHYFRWNIPSDGFIGNYMVVYSAVVDDCDAEAIETIKVVSKNDVVFTGPHYTTPELVISYLGGTATEDDVLEEYLAYVDGLIDCWTAATFKLHSANEKYDVDCDSQRSVYLNNYPIVEFLELKERDVIIDSENYVVYKDQGVITRIDAPFASDVIRGVVTQFENVYQIIEATYTYGRDSGIPAEVTFLASVIVAQIVENKLKEDAGAELKLEKIGDYTYENFKESLGSVNAERNKVIERLAKCIRQTYGTKPNTWTI